MYTAPGLYSLCPPQPHGCTALCPRSVLPPSHHHMTPPPKAPHHTMPVRHPPHLERAQVGSQAGRECVHAARIPAVRQRHQIQIESSLGPRSGVSGCGGRRGGGRGGRGVAAAEDAVGLAKKPGRVWMGLGFRRQVVLGRHRSTAGSAPKAGSTSAGCQVPAHVQLLHRQR